MLSSLFGPPDIEKLKAKRDIKGLIKVLSSSEKSGYVWSLARGAAAKALGQIGDTSAVEALVNALQGDAWDAAAEALGCLGDCRAVEPLIAILQPASNTARKSTPVIEALGSLRDVRAVLPLIALLEDRRGAWDADDTKRRQAIAQALRQIGDVRAVEPLTTMLMDKDPALRKTAAYSLEKMGAMDNPRRAMLAIADRQWNEAVSLGSAAVAPLILSLNNYGLREEAIEALAQIRDVGAIEPLTMLLRDSNSAIRERAAKALESLGAMDDSRRAILAVANRQWKTAAHLGAAAFEPLIEALKVSHLTTPNASRSVLNSATQMDQLSEARDRDVRSAVIEALIQLADERTVERLISLLKDYNSDVRRTAAQALGQLRDLRAVEPLVTAFKDIDVRSQSTQANGSILIPVKGTSSFLNIIEASDERTAMAEALVQLGDARAVKPLATELVVVVKNQFGRSIEFREVDQRLYEIYRQPLADDQRAIESFSKWTKTVDLGRDEVKPRALLSVVLSKWTEAASFGRHAVKPLIECVYLRTHAKRGIETLQKILENVASDIEAEDLRAITSIGDIEQIYYIEHGDGQGNLEYTESTSMEVDCSVVILLAYQELERRSLVT